MYGKKGNAGALVSRSVEDIPYLAAMYPQGRPNHQMQQVQQLAQAPVYPMPQGQQAYVQPHYYGAPVASRAEPSTPATTTEDCLPTQRHRTSPREVSCSRRPC